MVVFPGTGGDGTGGNGMFGSPGRGGRGGSSGNGGSFGSKGSGGRSGTAGSWSGGGNAGSPKGGIEDVEVFWALNSLEVWVLGFWLQRLGCFWGLKLKNPAEKMCIPSFLDLRRRDDEVAVEATAQYGSLLLNNFTEHLLIFLTCLLTEKGKWTLNSPCSSVFTSLRKLGFEFSSLHSTETDAPAHRINPEKNIT